MANSESAKKRNRQNIKNRLRNRFFRGKARRFVKKAEAAIQTENREDAHAMTIEAIRALDKASIKGVLHKNNASRRKSRLMKKLSALEKK